MSDTTCIFILDTYQVYLNTADLRFVNASWPHLVRAAQWQIERTIQGNGFPHHLQNTYDYLGLDQYANAAYSGFTHMAAMRAMVKLAEAVGDSSSLAANCTVSDTLCATTMNKTLWTGTHWRAAAPWQVTRCFVCVLFSGRVCVCVCVRRCACVCFVCLMFLWVRKAGEIRHCWRLYCQSRFIQLLTSIGDVGRELPQSCTCLQGCRNLARTCLQGCRNLARTCLLG
jgi:hypothetical protein